MIEVKNLSIGYDDNIIFKNINFQIPTGSICAITGENGIGKTTLLKTMLNLLKVKAGEIRFDQKNIADLSFQERGKLIAYVPQAKRPTMKLTVKQMVLLGRNPELKMFHQPKKEDEDRVLKVLEQLQLLEIQDCFVDCLSGGQLQMVLLARALMCDPKYLILDEPESNLDMYHQRVIIETIVNLSKQKNITCVFNTHFLQHAYEIADYVLLLKRNKECAFGHVNQVLNEVTIRDNFRVITKTQEVQYADKKYQGIFVLDKYER